MLQLKPNCECCDKDLPADSTDAMMCSYECTFCSDCVTNVLQNVCPNCGGGFVARPIRPQHEHRPGVSLKHQQPSTERVHSSYSREELAAFAEGIKDIPPAER